MPHCVWARVCACGCMGARAGAWVRAYGRVLVRACAWERVRACQCVDVCLGMRACAGVCPRAQELRVCVCACLHATATAQLSDGLCMCVPKLQWHAEPRTRVRARGCALPQTCAGGCGALLRWAPSALWYGTWTALSALWYGTGTVLSALWYGTGTGLIGMWKAFAELKAVGIIAPDTKLPRMVAVQARRARARARQTRARARVSRATPACTNARA